MAAMAQAVLHELLHGARAEAAPRALFLLASLSCIVLLPLLLLRRFAASTASARDDKLLSRLPSPPNKLPVIGHLHLMGALPHVSLAALAAKHGPDLMLLRLGAVPTVVASSPRAAEAVLRTHDHAFASRPRSMVADIIVYGASDSCYAPYGEHFRKVRKLVTVHLLNSKKVQSYRPAREEEVRLVMGKLAAAAASATCAAVDMSELLHSFANDLVSRAVSGKFFREEGRNNLFRLQPRDQRCAPGRLQPRGLLPEAGEDGAAQQAHLRQGQKNQQEVGPAARQAHRRPRNQVAGAP